MTIKEFLRRSEGPVCITGWLYKFKINVSRSEFSIFEYPENSPNISDQATIAKRLHNYNRISRIIVITNSAFVVSDFKKENVLVIPKKGKYYTPEFETFGLSVNNINMKILNHYDTIGTIAKETMQEICNRQNNTMEEINKSIKDLYDQLGESVERNIAINNILDKEEKILSKKVLADFN